MQAKETQEKRKCWNKEKPTERLKKQDSEDKVYFMATAKGQGTGE